ncbi:hypothetical protein Dimus_018540, partial [Dionaea muscipula]
SAWSLACSEMADLAANKDGQRAVERWWSRPVNFDLPDEDRSYPTMVLLAENGGGRGAGSTWRWMMFSCGWVDIL